MTYNNEVIMMIGPAGSGKSTWIKKFLEQNNEDGKYVVLSTDDIFVELGEKEGLNYNEAFAKFKYGDIEKIFYERLNQAVEDGKNIIWDQTNLTVKSRAKKLEKLPKAYKKKCVVFNLPKEVVLERAKNPDRVDSGKIIPASIIMNMFKQFEMPDQFEFDKIIEVITE